MSGRCSFSGTYGNARRAHSHAANTNVLRDSFPSVRAISHSIQSPRSHTAHASDRDGYCDAHATASLQAWSASSCLVHWGLVGIIPPNRPQACYGRSTCMIHRTHIPCTVLSFLHPPQCLEPFIQILIMQGADEITGLPRMQQRCRRMEKTDVFFDLSSECVYLVQQYMSLIILVILWFSHP